jgi:hypothetical protein
MVFETFPPKGTAPAQQPNTVVYLYKKSTGAQIGFSFVQNYSKIVRTGAEALLPDTYVVKIDQFAPGPYGFSVRTTESMPIIYFNEELSSDPFEDDDAVDADGMPLDPVAILVGETKNRYIDLGDADWFEICLP